MSGPHCTVPLTSAETLCYPYNAFLAQTDPFWMAEQTKRIEVTLETLLDSVDLAEHITLRIADAAGFEEEDCHKIGMSVREGVINAYNYGNQRERSKKIFLTVELELERMVIRVRDQGPGFEVKEIPDPLSEENLLRTSGRGLFLMRAFMDEFEVHKGRGGGAELVMVKRFPKRTNGRQPATE
jgi:serine/threonine-protein kinase RsbW